jgi:hypothetical protein
MAALPPSGSAARPAPPRPLPENANVEALPWVADGIAAGLIGASLVAIFFLVFDLLAGEPLRTPFALGAALFRGELPPAGTPVDPMLVLAYTALHGTVFIGFGVPAAFQMLARARAARGPLRAALLAVGLFAGFEVVFLSLGELFVPGLTGMLGAGRVAVANALAAAAMAAFLGARAAGRA